MPAKPSQASGHQPYGGTDSPRRTPQPRPAASQSHHRHRRRGSIVGEGVVKTCPRPVNPKQVLAFWRAMISIVMPAHNEQGYLEPAVKAVVAAGRDRNVPLW